MLPSLILQVVHLALMVFPRYRTERALIHNVWSAFTFRALLTTCVAAVFVFILVAAVFVFNLMAALNTELQGSIIQGSSSLSLKVQVEIEIEGTRP